MSTDADPLDPRTAVPLDPSSPVLDGLLGDHLPGAREILDGVRYRELERAAARPPVVNVTVTGVPGQFSFVPGSGRVAWSSR